jgi:hypothetical protein
LKHWVDKSSQVANPRNELFIEKRAAAKSKEAQVVWVVWVPYLDIQCETNVLQCISADDTMKGLNA